MPDIDRKFLRLDGVQHQTGCADAIGHPCDCGAEMRFVLELAIGDIFTGPDAPGEELSLEPLAEYEIVMGSATLRAMRQALANQRARAA